MMTREQAAEVWCPMVRMPRREPPTPDSDAEMQVGGMNRGFGALNPASCRCLADKCAMWRWVPSKEFTRERTVIEHGNGRFSDGYKEVPLPPAHGYCGLAGRPEIVSA